MCIASLNKCNVQNHTTSQEFPNPSSYFVLKKSDIAWYGGWSHKPLPQQSLQSLFSAGANTTTVSVLCVFCLCVYSLSGIQGYCDSEMEKVVVSASLIHRKYSQNFLCRKYLGKCSGVGLFAKKKFHLNVKLKENICYKMAFSFMMHCVWGKIIVATCRNWQKILEC